MSVKGHFHTAQTSLNPYGPLWRLRSLLGSILVQRQKAAGCCWLRMFGMISTQTHTGKASLMYGVSFVFTPCLKRSPRLQPLGESKMPQDKPIQTNTLHGLQNEASRELFPLCMSALQDKDCQRKPQKAKYYLLPAVYYW